MPASKQTSLQKVTDALTEHGWTFTTKETTVTVPDKDNPRYSRYSSRASYPNKYVPGVEVTADNTSTDRWDGKRFEAKFVAENGAYLREYVRGSYPFPAATLKEVLATIERFGPEAVKAKQAKEAEEKQRDREREAARVAEAYAKAQAAEAEAKAAALAFLKENFGLAANQSEALIEAATTADTPLTTLFNASVTRQRVGEGWDPERGGWGNLTGTYKDGKPVSG